MFTVPYYFELGSLVISRLMSPIPQLRLTSTGFARRSFIVIIFLVTSLPLACFIIIVIIIITDIP